MATLQFNQLSTMLTLWEDANLSASLLDRIIELKDKGKLTNINPLAFKLKGSELSDYGHLLQPIKDYHCFRNALEKGKRTINTEAFLPNVPFDMRGKFEKIEMLSRGFVLSPLSFPFYISRWIKHKSVVTLTEGVVIDEIPVQEGSENYLKYLPYETFLVSMAQPLTLSVDDEDFKTDTFFCTTTKMQSGDRVLNLFALANDAEKFKFTDDERKKVNALLQLQQGKFARSVNMGTEFCNHVSIKSTDLLSESAIDFSFLEKDGKRIKIRRKSTSVIPGLEEMLRSLMGSDYGDKKDEVAFKKLLSYVNGLGKMFFQTTFGYLSLADVEASAPKEMLNTKLPVYDETSYVEPTLDIKDNTPLAWNELSGSHVFNVQTKKVKGRQMFIVITNGQKNPHIRIRHPRTYKKKDGSKKEPIWIEQITVHKDRFASGEKETQSTALKVEN